MSGTNTAPSAITIGNFDGVHLGHQALIQSMTYFVQNPAFRTKFLNFNKDFAKTYHELNEKEQFEDNLISRIITFSPHPATVLSSKTIFPLMTDERRFTALKKFNPNHINFLIFNLEMSKLSCEEFCLYLIKEYNLKILFVGHDFKMGYDRCGFAKIQEIGQRYGFCVHQTPVVYLPNRFELYSNKYILNSNYVPIICSSNIRLALECGQIEIANMMLGEDFVISGVVEHGSKRGGDLLGFPTANLKEDVVIIPKNGVYVTKTKVLTAKYQDQIFNSVTNIGYNPTFGDNKRSIETFIMDFNDDLYGVNLQVEFLDFLRPEQKFDSPAELTQQINQDLEQAKEFFGIS